ncbi:Polygalacturonase [Paraburkholderia nemoris]|uniref:glycoside hydrolase family 28 protein n=1 Tax=Paraburkholderia nemoris TaxID=2793076 RepID=UPI0019099EAE|nr:glycosyl hydrolase family 28 protein [Paraburkholderia nemoris]MBK3787067.1 endopolygalacturonase [Paraburkholderia aspalathi]CAE6866239.1 Polygalacturonase [Paraburkholderia nemoris]
MLYRSTVIPCLVVILAASLAACGSGDSLPPASTSNTPPPAAAAFKVGVATSDAALPPAPQLPTASQVCSTLEASNNLVRQPSGALGPEADNGTTSAVLNPDQARIQAALDACGAAVDAQVGTAISAADAAAAASQTAAATPNVNIAGASAQQLAAPQYHAQQFAVHLVVSSTGAGNAFITGPLTLPSGVTLWIDTGVTVYATRDVMAYAPNAAGPYCANTAVSSTKAGSSSNCLPLIGGSYLVNSAVVGGGSIDGRAASEIVSSNPLYPLMRVDLSCTNTYAAYAKGQQASNTTPCDNGGTFVDTSASSRHMTWWDLAWLGNMIENGTTGVGSQSNFRMMVFNYAKNLTLFGITLNNSANFHVVPSGVDGLTVWNVKVQTPSLSASANPAGNGNPNYLGMVPTVDTAKNTDAFDPGSSSKPVVQALAIGSTKTSAAGKIAFDGYLKNAVFAYNYISTGDDDISPKGSNNPSPNGSGLFGIDGNRNVATDRQYGFVIAHNHIYAGHGISIGSETNAGVTNVQVYDNSFDGSEQALRIKSDWARGGIVTNINYNDICIRNSGQALLFTPYYSTKALSTPASPLYPDFHDISLSNVHIIGGTSAVFEGFQANTGGIAHAALPLGMTLTNLLADSPSYVAVTTSDANLTLNNVNLPIFPSTANRVVLNGAASQSLSTANAVDCSSAYVDFPGIGDSSPTGQTWAGSQ